MEDSNDTIKSFEKDDVYAKFIGETFDVREHANRSIHETVITEHLAKLTDGIALLDREIHSQIVTHHEDLLSTATGVETLEGVLQMMQSRIHSLLTAMNRIHSKVSEPFTKIQMQTRKLHRLQETCDLLRKIIRVMNLCKKLRSQLECNPREITKAAQCLNELGYVCDGVDFKGIDVIENDVKFMNHAREEVEQQAQKMLEQGINAQNQTQLSTSLQVFYNLGCLDVVVHRVIATCNDSLYENIRSSLNCQVLSHHGLSKGVPGKVNMPAPGNTASFRANLWTSLNKLMDQIYVSCSQMSHLQKLLMKKHDPVTHVRFIDQLNKNKDETLDIMTSFWQSVTTLLTNEFAAAANNSTFLKQALEGEYPKLLRLHNDLWKRLEQSNMLTISADDGLQDESVFPKTSAHIQRDLKADLHSSLQMFETAYLSRSLSRLFDPINLIFSSTNQVVPTVDEVDSLVKTITSELNVAMIDPNLMNLIAKNVAKTIQLFTVKSEQLVCTDGEASQVIGPPTTSQTQNVCLVNVLYHFYASIVQMVESLEGLSTEAKDGLLDSSKVIVELMVTCIQPLLSSVSDALDAILLTLHQEDFSTPATDTSKTDMQCSLYMRELQGFIARAYDDYFSSFTCTDFIMDSLLPVATRCIALFVRHASLIRPLGDGGKLRLAADFAQAELAISPLCRRIADLGKQYKILRAFRPLLFQTPENIADSPAVGEIIPHSIILHFLFARAPLEMKSPHQLSDWSVSRYSNWLDDHPSDQDQLLFIKGALEAYVQYVKSRQVKEFVPIYPVMLKLLQAGLQKTESTVCS